MQALERIHETDLDPGFAELLLVVLDQWVNATIYDDGVLAVSSLLTHNDDGISDVLTGSSGRDLFFAAFEDDITDLQSNESVL